MEFAGLYIFNMKMKQPMGYKMLKYIMNRIFLSHLVMQVQTKIRRHFYKRFKMKTAHGYALARVSVVYKKIYHEYL
jgi:hypothetical protein